MTVELDITLTDLETNKANRLTHWTEYNVTNDINSPANFGATLAALENQRQWTTHGGQKAQVFSYGALQQTAYCDERSEATNQSSTDLQVTGRCVRGLLMDSVVDSSKLSMGNLTLDRIADRITAPWQPDYLTSITTNNAANRYSVSGTRAKGATKTRYNKEFLIDSKTGKTDFTRYYYRTIPGKKAVVGSKNKFGKDSPVYRGITSEKITQNKIGPEEKVADVLARLCKDIAAVWFVGADGTLIITRPTYDFDSSVYGEGIVQHWDKKAMKATGGNVMRSQFDTSIAARHSETMAWATVKPQKTTTGNHAISNSWSVKDPGKAFWARNGNTLGAAKLHKPDRKVFKTLNDPKMIRRRVRGIFEEAVIAGWSLNYQIYSHTINGVMPVVDSMINVHDERYGLTTKEGKGGPYYITRVERRLSIGDGRTTVLHLIPAKIWLYFDHDETSDSEYESWMVDKVFW
ncbi:MAG: hypothetical protein V3W44_10725 [Dehalococcoidales bacterium]